jgi:hypothetical protein
MLFVDEQGITTLQIKDGTKVLEDNKDILIPVYLPTTASPEFMVMEEVWNVANEIYLF